MYVCHHLRQVPESVLYLLKSLEGGGITQSPFNNLKIQIKAFITDKKLLRFIRYNRGQQERPQMSLQVKAFKWCFKPCVADMLLGINAAIQADFARL